MPFNNILFSGKTIERVSEVHPSIQRLYQAAKELRDVTGQSAVARLLEKTPQVVKNWEARGISSEGALLAQKIIGCDANWVLEGSAQMRDAARLPTPELPAKTVSPGPEQPTFTGTDHHKAPHPIEKTHWPFRHVSLQRIVLLKRNLGAHRGRDAMNDIGEMLESAVVKWERRLEQSQLQQPQRSA
jgi:hypothetical protein